jgi:hypothetical protein
MRQHPREPQVVDRGRGEPPAFEQRGDRDIVNAGNALTPKRSDFRFRRIPALRAATRCPATVREPRATLLLLDEVPSVRQLRRGAEHFRKMAPRVEPSNLGDKVEGVAREVASETADAYRAVRSPSHRAGDAPMAGTSNRQPRGLTLSIAWMYAEVEGLAQGPRVAQLAAELTDNTPSFEQHAGLIDSHGSPHCNFSGDVARHYEPPVRISRPCPRTPSGALRMRRPG